MGGGVKRAEVAQPREENLLIKAKGILPSLQNKYLMGGCTAQGDRLFPVVASGRTRGHGHKLKEKRFPLNIRTSFSCEGNQALEQVSYWGCGVSIL